MTVFHGTRIGVSGMGMGGTGIGEVNPPGIGNRSGMHSNPPPPPDPEVDGLSFKEPSMGATPGFGQAHPCCSSAPVGEQGGFSAIRLWGNYPTNSSSALESSIDDIMRTSSVSNGIIMDFTSSQNGPMRNGCSNSVGDSMGSGVLLPEHTTANLGMTMFHGTRIGVSGMGMGGTGIGEMNPPGIGNRSGMQSHAINPPPPPDLATPGFGQAHPCHSSAPVGEQGGFSAIIRL